MGGTAKKTAERGERLRSQIVKATEAVGKTYAFDERHDPNHPIEHFFQESTEGLVLFVVFYTMACRYSACLGCNLPATSSLHYVDFRALIAQIDRIFASADVKTRAPEVTKLIVSNQGSVLDEDTFSSTALIYLVAQANLRLPRLRVLCLETRAEYIDEAELEFLGRAIKEAHTEDATLELAIGFEAFDDGVRNRVFNKGVSLAGFERVVDLVSRHRFQLKTYFMQKPVPDMSDQQGIDDVRHAIDYLAGLAREHNVVIGMHLNPTYVARGTPLQQAFDRGDYTPPTLVDVARAVLNGRGKSLPIYIGLYDEGLAVPGGSFIRPGDDETVAVLQRFNTSQDYALLERLAQ